MLPIGCCIFYSSSTNKHELTAAHSLPFFLSPCNPATKSHHASNVWSTRPTPNSMPDSSIFHLRPDTQTLQFNLCLHLQPSCQMKRHVSPRAVICTLVAAMNQRNEYCTAKSFLVQKSSTKHQVTHYRLSFNLAIIYVHSSAYPRYSDFRLLN